MGAGKNTLHCRRFIPRTSILSSRIRRRPKGHRRHHTLLTDIERPLTQHHNWSSRGLSPYIYHMCSHVMPNTLCISNLRHFLFFRNIRSQCFLSISLWTSSPLMSQVAVFCLSCLPCPRLGGAVHTPSTAHRPNHSDYNLPYITAIYICSMTSTRENPSSTTRTAVTCPYTVMSIDHKWLTIYLMQHHK